MPHIPQLLLDLATTLGVAAVTTLLFRRLKQPAVLGCMLAGLIVGPHVPVPLVADVDNVNTLAELGVVLLMFCVGLEFDFRKLSRKGPSALVMGVMQLGITSWLGFLAGRALGWTVAQSAFMGAALSLSSTMIIAKLFEEHGTKGALRDGVLAVLVVQDLFAILLLAGLDAASAAGAFGTLGMVRTLGKVGLFLLLMLGGGGLVVPRLLRWAADRGRDETLLVASVGICFAAAVLAAKTGCSLALGAFLAGMLASGSGRVRNIERLVFPLRDMFSAIFFVAVGMKLAPQALFAQWLPILLLTVVVLVGDTLAVTLGGLLAGQPFQRGLRTGLTLAQPGEFSFVLVGLGATTGFLGPTFFPVAVGVCLLTALAGPFFLRRGGAMAQTLELAIPARTRWYLLAYQGWSGKLGRSTLGKGPSPVKGPIMFLVLDALLIHACVIGTWLLLHRVPMFQSATPTHTLLALALAAVALLAWTMYRRAGDIAALILDTPGQAPPAGRRQLLAALRMALLFTLGAPSLAILQPFLPGGPALAVMLAVVGGFMALLWMQTRKVPWEQVMGSEWLLHRVKAPWAEVPEHPEGSQALLSLRLGPRCPFLGMSLGELAKGPFSAITVVAMVRAGGAMTPLPQIQLQEGDLLAIKGRPEAVEMLEAQAGLS
jgi:CPA2 family monovalent cation:H+ antiporter-2